MDASGAAGLTADQVTASALGARAAAHLLALTGPDGAPVLSARVRDWPALLADRELYLTGGDRRLLDLAASWDAGIPVSLAGTAA